MATTAPATGPTGPTGPTTRSPFRSQLLVAIVVASAVAAALSPARPVGLRAADAVWCALLGATVAWLAARAPKLPLVLLGGVAAVVGIGGDITGQVAAVATLVLVGVLTFTGETTRLEAAALGALAVQALLRGPSYGFLGLPTLVGALALAPVVVTGWRAQPDEVRRGAGRALAAIAGVVVLASLGAALAALTVRGDLETAAERAEGGLDLVSDGEPDAATAEFDAAGDGFRGARGTLDGPLTWAGRFVPVVGQHVHALRTAAGAGERLADTASRTTSSADYRSLTPEGGVIDLTQVAALQGPVAETVPVIDQASADLAAVRSPWLVEPVTRELRRLHAELIDTGDTARLAARGLAVAPDLLGADRPRHYFVAFATPAESRDGGGLVGAYAILTVDQGRLEVATTGDVESLEPVDPVDPVAAGYDFDPPADWQERYGDYVVNTYLRNSAASPDWPTDASVIAQLYPQTPGGHPIDGAIYADPAALAGLLALTGPIEVPGVPVVLDADNAEEYLLRDQYLAFGDDDLAVEARRESLGAVAEATFEALTDRPLPELGTAVDVLGPLVAEGHLRVAVNDPTAATFLTEVGLSGAWRVRPDADVLSVRSSDRLSNKIDTFLHRDIDVDTRVDPSSGRVHTTVTATLRNEAPASGLPLYVIGNWSGLPTGTNLHLLTLYTPHGLSRATLDGEPVGVRTQDEFGVHTYGVPVELAPMSTRTLVLELEGFTQPGQPYRLDVIPQPTANPDELTLRIGRRGAEGGNGSPMARGAVPLVEGPLTERLELDVAPWAE